jgi:hypothetical protein
MLAVDPSKGGCCLCGGGLSQKLFHPVLISLAPMVRPQPHPNLIGPARAAKR